MNATLNERRSPSHIGRAGVSYDACTIAQALTVQKTSNLLSAVEYLQARGVDGTVIRRVLSGDAVRDLP
ncbi:hypothetical protein ACHAC9_09695 [Massilia sp. CMS3.1]|uniref:hypothetical protein n=1 Tax=Massilia sp. CMS3.1 TaxID=3373083 RepID=UPI003EE4B6CA